VVRDATEKYLADEDVVTQWMGECCCLDDAYAEGSTALFESWKTWADKVGA
jgi:phage/plasmid-associated DNA primase